MTNDPAPEKISRRRALGTAGKVTGAALAVGLPRSSSAAAPEAAPSSNAATPAFVYCLNMSTIRGHKLDLMAELELAAKAGYHAIEPWVENIKRYAQAGGSLKDIAKKATDLGVTIESTIGFAAWIVDDDAERAKGLEQAKQELKMVQQIGAKRYAAPPVGATKVPGLDLRKAGERYRALLELAEPFGVVPELEIWGHSQNLHRLSEALFVAAEADHPKACILADVYHLHKGGSGLEGLKLVYGPKIPVLHMNDYPAEPGVDKIDDSFRVFPGDGVAPLSQILKTLHDNGGSTVLSLELFNREYWRQDALHVAEAGLEKMKTAVAKAIG